MNFFLMKQFTDDIKSGKPIMYHNIEMTSEEVKKRFFNTFHKKEKLVQTKYEPDPNKRSR